MAIPTDAELLRAIAVVIRNTYSAWAPLADVSSLLKLAPAAVVEAAKRNTFCTYLNGHLRAKKLKDIFITNPLFVHVA